MAQYKLNMLFSQNQDLEPKLDPKNITYFKKYQEIGKSRNHSYNQIKYYFQIYLISKEALNQRISTKKAKSYIEKILTEQKLK